jgi:hypothetical protein
MVKFHFLSEIALRFWNAFVMEIESKILSMIFSDLVINIGHPLLFTSSKGIFYASKKRLHYMHVTMI